MRKLTLSLLAVSLVILMVTSAYANGCGCREPGFTPGFWKHAINVALEYKPGSPGAFEGGPLDGVKPDLAMLQGWADSIGVSLDDALADLTARGPGSNTVRADMANAFNYWAGYGPFED